VPVELIAGTAAKVAVSRAMHAGDEEAVVRLNRAIDRACEAGKLMIMD